MDSIKPTSNPSKTKLSKTFHKVIQLKTSTKSFSQNGFRLLMPQEKPKRDFKIASQNFDRDQNAVTKLQNRDCLEAFVAKLFAGVSGVKAAYAELQLAQFPYNGEAIQSADETMVSELKALLELKQSFSKKQIDYAAPPHVTILLSEIQEQQSMRNMYEITIKKMQNEIESKKAKISFLQKDLNGSISKSRLIEKRLNSSGCFSVIDSINLSDPNPNNFMVVLQYVVRSVRSFVKLMIQEMEFVGWDIDQAANSIEPYVIFSNPNHRCFAFESFVCQEIFDGFDFPDFSLSDESLTQVHERRSLFSDRFKILKSVNPIRFLKQNPNSSFGKFTRFKYLRLVHPKMEESFSGNLNCRKMISSGAFPETGFFAAFAEMAKRVWLLHCLAFAFDHREVNLFQVKKNCRFSEVYMEGVNDDVLKAAGDSICGDFVVAFTVVPGFKIGETVIQSQVYLSPAETPAG